MEAVDDLEERYRGDTVEYRGARWRIESVFATHNATGHPAECAASGRTVPVDGAHLVVGAERLEYSYDFDHRTAFVVGCPETLRSWVGTGVERTSGADGADSTETDADATTDTPAPAPN
ncbi:hypothetical protein ACFO0N_03800 [Halobium salinum]|uniref:Uncharacterized protein n=1 Tax=Halobium salinum TaxID=1364940 RepID=A0ABD5P845_9EURY|nr:hypothetical protein [Halobium salinum]